jgi:AmmeMemoRadiSam system protein B
MKRQGPAVAARGIAGIVPHAGWEYSGSLALEVFSCLSRTMDTIVIIGGHLGPADGIMCLTEDAYETPFGPVTADLALLSALREALAMHEDRQPDNTVEVQLPFVAHLFPGVMALGLRAPPSAEAVRLGETVAAAAIRLGRRVAVAGSTDLTHYGSGYGFAPAGFGEKALRWVREVNDRRIVEVMTAMDTTAALERARDERSACSVGGAVAAIAFARSSGATTGTLLRYATSCGERPADSFVGYAGILYS